MKRFVLVFLIFPMLLTAQHTISGKFSPPEDYSYVFLYKTTPRSMEFVERSEIDSLGRFNIEIDTSASAGIYKIVYAIPQNENYFNVLYSGKEDIELTFSLESGLDFTESTENKLWTSYTNSMEMVNATISSYYNIGKEDREDFKTVFKALADLQKAYEENSEGYLAKKLIRANKPYIPSKFEGLSTYAKNLKDNYLKNLDFSNELLHSSELITDKVMTFVFGISEDTSDKFYQGQLEKLNKYTADLDEELQLTTYLPIWEHFKLIGNNYMAKYMIDTKLMQLATTADDHKLIQTFSDFNNTAIGAKAIDFEIKTTMDGVETTTSLHKLDSSENYLLIFWSSSCAHCLSELPKVKELLKTKPNTKVIAFGMEDDDATWAPEIRKYPEFIHVFGANKWNNEIVEAYSVNATPSYFYLDKDKTIVAKPDNIMELVKLLKK